MRAIRALMPLAIAASLAACGGRVVPPSPLSSPPRQSPRPPVRGVPSTPLSATPVTQPPGGTAATSALTAGPPIANLPIDPAKAEAAKRAFSASCPALLRRTDLSGLTRAEDWRPACDAARGGGDALGFFADQFEAVQVGDGRAFATGYYEPEIAAARDPGDGYATPIYARPTDLIDVDLGQFLPDMRGKKLRGKLTGTSLVPYDDRTAIEGGSLDGRARILAYAADPVALFFLQIQGSGRLKLPDGGIMRIGFDDQNGRDYTGIGALMKARGLVGPGQTSMQGLVAWLHAHPDEGAAIMRENRSYVFFRELKGPPVGALGTAVVGGTSVAADVRFVPLGAPIFLSMDRADATGLWVAQDTGGAIKGANRVDTYWGGGAQAEAIAGGMSAHGTAFVLLPRGTLARLRGGLQLPPLPVDDGTTP